MTDRDRHRLGDPLHDTMDESDRVVVDVIDPDPTPVPDVVASIAAVVGELNSNDRDRLADVIAGHDKRAKTRAANHLLAAVAVDQRKVIAEVDRDLPEWVREINERTDKAEARAVAAERLAAKVDARWKWPMRIVSGLAALSIGAAGWLLRETRASGYAAKTEEIYRAQVDANTKAVSELREAFAEMRGQLNRPYPFRVLPVSGPRNDPSKE